MSATPSALETTLYREGDDLDQVLAALDAQYPGQVRITDVAYGRSGGMMGFFAKRRVAVHYTLTNLAAAPLAPPTLSAEPLDELLRAADAAESREVPPPRAPADRPVSPGSARLAAAIVESGRAPAGVDGLDDETTNVEFARMLLEMASQKAAERRTPPPAPTSLVTPTPTPQIQAPLAPTHPRPANPVRPAAPFAPASPMPPIPAMPAAAEPPAASTQNPPASWTPIQAPRPGRPGRRRAAGAHRAADEATATELTPGEPVNLAPASQPVAIAPPASGPAGPNPASLAPPIARSPFTLRRRLIELGVPVDWIPADSGDAYWVIEQLVNRLPVAPAPQLGPTDVIVIAGPAAAAVRAARQLATRLRLDPAAIRLAASSAEPDVSTELIVHGWQATDLAEQLRRLRTGPTIVVVATDEQGGEDAQHRWAAGIVAALAPDQLWLVVDATQKPTDSYALLTGIGRVDALIITGAARTTSPASVWQLHTPVAVLEGRPATAGSWAVLLIDKLNALA